MTYRNSLKKKICINYRHKNDEKKQRIPSAEQHYCQPNHSQANH